uniref:Transketolase N-terminal domain-containing protein n=1 Tax=Brassica oleracea TaxID=3712 RepID=A0A3P6EZN7_BRAOL|nr:unnamed protein product [Brassica oleracea]
MAASAAFSVRASVGTKVSPLISIDDNVSVQTKVSYKWQWKFKGNSIGPRGPQARQEEDLKSFRQWGSKTPGHPENFETPGIEVTTGPLGQGIANAVGLALAEKHLAARFNKPGAKVCDPWRWLSDGGISNEAAFLAGHWGLGKLIAFYDDNHISIDGDTAIAFTENVDQRFEALGWHVIWVKNFNTGYDEIRAAIKEAKAVTDKPTLIKVTTTIGYGSPNKANSYSVHGACVYITNTLDL